MINLDQIDEWIHEVEERPSSASLIIRYIASRLRDLSSRNEELLADNIELRTGKKVEDYESRIANLEYQLDLLKRQLGGEMNWLAPAQAIEVIDFFVYTIKGQVIHVATPVAELEAGKCILRMGNTPEGTGPLRLLATSPTEELLFVYDSGRTMTMPVAEIPAAETANPGWQNAFLAEPHGTEELVTILPVARMTLSDCCMQVSRRGCVKKMMKNSFESHVAKSFVGTGVKGKPDKTCNLVLSGKEDLLVLASREGFIWCLDVSQLPYTIEEVIKLGTTDYLATSFVISSGSQNHNAERKQSILIVTHNGKAINREVSWLEKPASYKSRGQTVFSQARREAGVRIAGAVLVEENDWGAALTGSGEVTLHKVSDLLTSGSMGGEPPAGVVEFITFHAPGATNS